ncbi:MAG: lactonase family protein, partial [Verrucomicrobia bacterium]|nr:lactonase family protein [Verrucomicrobiota bacterium]
MKTTSSCAAGPLANTAPIPNSFRVYFGTQAEDDDRGIYMALLDIQTGQLNEPVRVSDSVRPGFIAIHPDGQHLYATEATGRAPAAKSGFVSAYRIEEPTGTLKDLNTQASGGAGPCYVSISPNGKNLLVANYRGGSCAVLPIQSDGTLGEASSVQQHNGSGPHPTRQEAAHTHSISCTPDGRFALVADLGMDQILTYGLKAETLTPGNPPLTRTAPGSGPRHLAIHPSGKFVYASMELNGTVVAYDYKEGTLTEIQTRPTLPDGFNGENTTSEVCITPDGRFLYVGNRGHESLAIFAIDPES